MAPVLKAVPDGCARCISRSLRGQIQVTRSSVITLFQRGDNRNPGLATGLWRLDEDKDAPLFRSAGLLKPENDS